MSFTLSQLADELSPLAVADFVQLPPAPKPVPPKPAPAKPAAAPTTPTTADTAAAAGSPSVAAPAAKDLPAAVPAAPVVAPKPLPVQILDFASKGVHLDVCVTPENVIEAAKILDRHGFAMDAVTGQDWLVQGLMEVIYDFLHFQTGERVVFRARISRADPRIATISEVFPGANWHERETHDMFGIVFIGHPNLTPFLLPDDADFHPLRKDYNP